MKPATKLLIESFRYRREGYLPRLLGTDRRAVAILLRSSRLYYGSSHLRQIEIQCRDFRRELMQYRSTNFCCNRNGS